jgi:hypothetical protein
MPSTPKPTLDDLCAAVARLEYMLGRADRDTLLELQERLTAGPHAARTSKGCLAELVQVKIDKRSTRR